jgi:hypothetical protein
MAMLGLDIYEIDFNVLENNNPKTLVIFDQSNYLNDPEKPIYKIKLPGYNTYVIIPYVINNINVLNSNLLGITNTTCSHELVELHDGIYEITQAVCPYDELYTTKLYLKTTKFDCNYKKLLLSIDCGCNVEYTTIVELALIDILISSAKAEVEKGFKENGFAKYQCAVEKLNKLQEQINCNN